MTALTHSSSRLFAVLSLLLVMLIWGSTFVVTKSAIGEIPPFLLATLRYVVACAILVPVAARTAGWGRVFRGGTLGTLAVMGFAGVTVFYVGFNLALVYTTASAVALIQGATPAITALLAVPLLGERPRRTGLLGIAVSMLGVALIVLVGSGGNAPNPLQGDALTLLAVVSWSLYTILAKRFDQVSPLVVTTAISLFGLVFLVPFAAYDLAVRPPAAVSLASGLAVLYLGACASALAYLFWNRALLVFKASQVANFINLVPLVGVASAAVFLGEPLLPLQLVGGALVLLGVWLSAR